MILSLFLSYSRKAILHSPVCIYLLQERLCTTGMTDGEGQYWFGRSAGAERDLQERKNRLFRRFWRRGTDYPRCWVSYISRRRKGSKTFLRSY